MPTACNRLNFVIGNARVQNDYPLVIFYSLSVLETTVYYNNTNGFDTCLTVNSHNLVEQSYSLLFSVVRQLRNFTLSTTNIRPRSIQNVHMFRQTPTM